MENKPKHTPGKWLENMDGEIFSEGGHRICNPFLSGGTVPPIEVQEANAALIAAGPELLEALKKLEARVDWFLSEDFGKALGINYNPLSEEFFELEQARAAIAKAEGK